MSESNNRIFMKARTTQTLIWTARRLLRILAAMMAPRSLKAYGKYLRC
jgi:hypothetical protein